MTIVFCFLIIYIFKKVTWLTSYLVCLSVIRFIYSAMHFGHVCVILLSIAWLSPDDNDTGTMPWHFKPCGPVCFILASWAQWAVRCRTVCVCLSAAIKPRRERERERKNVVCFYYFYTTWRKSGGFEHKPLWLPFCSLGLAFFTSFCSPNYAMQINALTKVYIERNYLQVE